ncbi:MAG: polyprenol monophosphomannose synthase [Anaerolineales bacterium]|nr:polyprenol monophosphomannose synthase [Anaerolineales bacterium]MBP6211076.1 polyprenol monophosphomannose synthase [Anaerolineales bacterium]
MRITVITPTYNEAENLPKLVSALFSLPLDLRILVVDDNSPDGTGQIADNLAVANPGRLDVLHQSGKMGLRLAYLNGFRKVLAESDAQAIVQMDADFSHDPSILATMEKLLAAGDLVLGSRYIPGGAVDKNWPTWRKNLSAFGNLYARTILNVPLYDVTTGYRMWKRETLEHMPLERVQASGYVFQVEMAYLAYCLGFNVIETPIYFPDRQRGKSKISFKIQSEAAFRVWQVLWGYKDLRKAGKAGRI